MGGRNLDKNTVVWASAGTGKTRKLVEVYLELIASGVDPLRIVAMTFTEKAAAEMRDRIRESLYARQGGWTKTIAVLPLAPISTIHGFCGMLLREHGLHLGIDPLFTILDEQRSLDLAREAARETIRHEIRSGNEEVEKLFGDFGLERLVETMVSAGYWLNSLGADAGWLEARVEDQRRAAAALEQELGDQIRKYGGDCESIGELADELEARKAKHPLRKRDDPCALLPKIGQIAGVATAGHLSRLVLLSVERFRSRKRSLNAMDFDDLLLGVRDLLRTQPQIRRHYQTHFQALLVDEFQDTDEVQAEIISLLAEDPENPGRFAPAKLMVVGDPKQSIYRFRRARVAVFFRILQRILAEGGAIIHLQENYRSAPPIADFSNRISSAVMDGRGKVNITDEIVDLSYRISFKDEDHLKPKSESPFLGITYVAAESGAKAAQGREMEAEAIARLLKEWKSSGRIQSWKEVAILLRAMTNVENYLSALDAHHIPVYVVQGTSFYQKNEVSDLIAFLELVLHPEDALLRATVLTSSLFGMTVEALYERLARSASAIARSLNDSPPLQQYEPILAHWVERRDSATAAEILQDVIRRTNFDVVMMAQKNGPQRVANIGKLIEVTRDLARQGTTALDDVVRYLRDRAQDTTVREQEAQIAGQEDDVVRVLTVHQAKGLEFDIVIIPDLAAKTGRANGDRTFFSDRWGILAGAAYGLHRKPLPHSLILEAKELEEDQQYEEEKRLLYVAVTRARKMLVLGEGFAKQTGPWLQWMEQLFEKLQPGVIEKARDGKTQTVKLKGYSVKVLPASQLNMPEQLAFSTDTILVGEPGIGMVPPPRLIPTLEMTPSDLSSLSGCFRHFQWTRILGLPEPGREATGDTPHMRLGSIAHKMLETAIAPASETLAAAGLADLGAVFESPEWFELDSASPEREMPFIMHMNVGGQDCWVRGRMDAVVPAEVPRVIDYKYAQWRDGGETAYEIQMTAYSLALMKALGTDRAIGELWYLKSPMKIFRHEYTIEEAGQRLTELFSKYVAAIENDEWPAAERAYCDRVECGFRRKCWSLS
jgi:ATP-dependent helicase/nuclease subunit A